ncbi:hypothetical protein ADUPG1_001050, partial [Aduncisulcus paluster]
AQEESRVTQSKKNAEGLAVRREERRKRQESVIKTHLDPWVLLERERMQRELKERAELKRQKDLEWQERQKIQSKRYSEMEGKVMKQAHSQILTSLKDDLALSETIRQQQTHNKNDENMNTADLDCVDKECQKDNMNEFEQEKKKKNEEEEEEKSRKVKKSQKSKDKRRSDKKGKKSSTHKRFKHIYFGKEGLCDSRKDAVIQKEKKEEERQKLDQIKKEEEQKDAELSSIVNS